VFRVLAEMNPWITTIRFHGLPDSDAVVLCRLAAGTLRVIGLGVALAFCIPNGECIALSRGVSRTNTRIIATRWRSARGGSCAPIQSAAGCLLRYPMASCPPVPR
jgi:hypothetical protein